MGLRRWLPRGIVAGVIGVFGLHPSYWGEGLAVETAAATVRYAFTVMAIQEVWAGAAVWNQPSVVRHK
jgi:RimJ/RimL family protein N-acetyltransferase